MKYLIEYYIKDQSGKTFCPLGTDYKSIVELKTLQGVTRHTERYMPSKAALAKIYSFSDIYNEDTYKLEKIIINNL